MDNEYSEIPSLYCACVLTGHYAHTIFDDLIMKCHVTLMVFCKKVLIILALNYHFAFGFLSCLATPHKHFICVCQMCGGFPV
jgi:hypothetical protein